MNWIQTRGNFFRIEKSVIKYIPSEDLAGFSHEKLKRTKYTGQIKSSQYFESGAIHFKLNLLEDNEAFFNLLFSNREVQVALNSTQTIKAFSIKGLRINNKSNIYTRNVDKSSIKKNYDYEVEISVNGSIVKVSVDGIQILSTNVQVIVRDQIKIVVRSKSELLIKDFVIKTQRPKVFVVMQFSEEYNQLYSQVIKPVCEEYGYECLRGDEYFTTGTIIKDIIDAINESAIIIADITPNNPNVFYEVGYSHALNKPTILLSDKKRDKLPFDVSGFRTLFYDNTIGGKSEVEDRLRKHLESIQTN